MMSLVWNAAASTQGHLVDRVFFILFLISALITILVFGLLIGFAVRYRHGSSARRGELPSFFSREAEIGWTLATLFLFVFIFWWAGSSEVAGFAPPHDALEVHVTAKQWMFKTQHQSGAREIDQLHVPVDTPVRLVMASQDVIHSFWIPAFRVKRDILPGRITQIWFQADKTGTYHLFCAEFCGTDHSQMGGEVVVMPKQDYAVWTARQPQGDDLAHQGAALFARLGCSGCHTPGSDVKAPRLDGLYGRRIPLADGSMVEADERYIRDSILQPRREVAAGYPPVMPSFAGIVGEDDLAALVAYIRAQNTPATGMAGPAAASETAAPGMTSP